MTRYVAGKACHSGSNPGSHGFTLLEVLIALVVLSLGLLGIAALQGAGLRSSHGAQLNSQAVLLAYDLADRIRANPRTLAAYDGFTTDDVTCPSPWPVTSLDLANDLQEWACTVRALLPNNTAGAERMPSGTIQGVQNLTTGTIAYTITLRWQDRQLDDGADVWSYVLVLEI